MSDSQERYSVGRSPQDGKGASQGGLGIFLDRRSSVAAADEKEALKSRLATLTNDELELLGRVVADSEQRKLRALQSGLLNESRNTLL